MEHIFKNQRTTDEIQGNRRQKGKEEWKEKKNKEREKRKDPNEQERGGECYPESSRCPTGLTLESVGSCQVYTNPGRLKERQECGKTRP